MITDSSTGPRAIAWKSGCQILKHLANTHNIRDINPPSGGGLHPQGFQHPFPALNTEDTDVQPPSSPAEMAQRKYRRIEPKFCQRYESSTSCNGPLPETVGDTPCQG